MIADKLKQAILQAAIQGKLTEQLPSDGDARDLVKQIKAEKDKLIKEGKIKKEKPLPEITENDIPFEIPGNWCWVRLGNIFNMQAGKNIQASEIKISGNYPCYGGNGIRGYVNRTNRKGSYPIIGRQGALCGNINIAIGEFYATEHAVVVDSFNFCDTYWSAIFLKALNLNQYATATAQPGLSVNKIRFVLIPLPPLAEQQRIVERINALLPDLEKLHKEEAQLETLQQAFPKKMKDSLLQSAIQGKLTEQLASDGDARDLVKRIKVEKDKLIKEGEIKKEKPLPEITEDEIPFEIPQNWCWVRLGEIGYSQTGTTPSTLHKEYYGKDIPFLKPPYIYNDHIDYNMEGLSRIGKEKARIIEKNSILMVCIGGSTGKCFSNNQDVCCNQQINAITPFIGVDSLFLLMLMQSSFFQSSVWSIATGTATSIVNKENWRTLIFPLPPLAEQQRIVERLEQLLPLCDKLN